MDGSLKARDRARRVGRRHGVLDARQGASGPSCKASSIVGYASADAYEEGWREGYDATMAPLKAEGTRVSVPSLVPGERAAALTTGGHRVVQGEVWIECMTPSGTAPVVLPVRMLRITE